jgi:hypothetical protein
MSSRIGGFLLYAGVGVAGLAVAGATAYFGGSNNVAWGVASVATGMLLIAPLEGLGMPDWLARASPRARSVVAGVGILLAAGGTAVYLVTDSVAAWWLAPLAAFPVIYLLLKLSDESDGGGGMEGPYTPPDAGA